LEVRDLIQRMAHEDPRWAGIRIQGELRKLGYHVSVRSVRRYRRVVRRRPPSQSWRTFLRNHALHIWAADFLTVQTISFHTRYIFFFITYDRRRLVHLNVTARPTAEWLSRQLIATTPYSPQHNYLIRDGDACYGGSFIPRAAKLGMQTVLTPVHAPEANAIAERLVGTLRRDCLDHVIIFNERHLLRLLAEYVAHYNAARPHRSLGLDAPNGPIARAAPPPLSWIVARSVFGGLEYEYEWMAA